MNRRKFLLGTGISVAALAGAGFTWTQLSSASDKLRVELALDLLDSIDSTTIQSNGQWKLTHIFDHCAKSIEFSMIGFPEHKSSAFKSTIGTSAFALFKANGAMSHNLAEEIPGALYPNASKTIEEAIFNLKSAFQAFETYPGQLQQHFAYGKLNKRDYEIAHVMHLLNHWSEIRT
ncbi:DUF1569 domain-containing protein [Kangiella sp. HZ709]|uniref:DUF1569 domain-containing protein n=1 Tax=Kangiella sp. HZ709 TaxID=2666328 RepID=UPI0012AF2A50|nr:DUF1569 domain-containing protein [Kangiella sp. HZ709]MRX27432.1 DUF1569 domain-containing protein [Kangiella sp. HZ709]